MIFLYGLWEARRGFRSWTVVSQGEGDLVIPSFRRIWWWIPVSFVIQIAGLVPGAKPGPDLSGMVTSLIFCLIW